MPLDRVEVLSSAPPLGKVDIYERWAEVSQAANADSASLVVVSLGSAAEAHELSPDEIAGALAGQIERLILDRYQREQPKEAITPVVATTQPDPASAALHATGFPVEAAQDVTLYQDNLTDLRTVREHMEELRKGLPIPAAGPSKNGVHPEPSPAS